MVEHNPEKDAYYTVFGGEISELADQLRDFCFELYGDRCEFHQVSVEREKSDGGSWKIHEYEFLNDRAVNAITSHLNARRDLVRVFLGSSDEDYDLELIICPVRNTAALARFVDRETVEALEDDSLVVLAVEKDEDAVADVKEFLSNIE